MMGFRGPTQKLNIFSSAVFSRTELQPTKWTVFIQFPKSKWLTNIVEYRVT